MNDCPECGAVVLPGAIYCRECGYFLLDASKEPDGFTHPFADADDKEEEPALLGRDSDETRHVQEIVFVIPSSGRRVRLPLREGIHVGRADPNTNTLPQLDLSIDRGAEYGVSRLHAVIAPSGEGVTVTDRHSTNGTELNNYRLPPELPYPIHNGDELRFGHLLVHVFLE